MDHYKHIGHHNTLSIQLNNLNSEILILSYFKEKDPNFNKIDKEEQSRIIKQLFHMEEYKKILTARMHHIHPTIPHDIKNTHDLLEEAEKERSLKHTQSIADLTNYEQKSK